MTPDPDDRIAVTHVSRALTLEGLTRKIVSRGSTVTRAEVLSVFEELCLAVEETIKEGGAVNTPLFKISQSIRGNFTKDDDSFDKNRHEVRLQLHAGKRLRRILQNVTVEKVAAARQQPVPGHFYDHASGTQDKILTPGGPARITGSRLKFKEDEAQCGIFFIHSATGATVRVASKLRNKPSELIFPIPENLPTGTYNLEVRTIFKGNKIVRIGVLPYALTTAS